ncbi:MAG: hypothetical protein ABEN55_07385 [Bradymonadaceae bacterium]
MVDETDGGEGADEDEQASEPNEFEMMDPEERRRREREERRRRRRERLTRGTSKKVGLIAEALKLIQRYVGNRYTFAAVVVGLAILFLFVRFQ